MYVSLFLTSSTNFHYCNIYGNPIHVYFYSIITNICILSYYSLMPEFWNLYRWDPIVHVHLVWDLSFLIILARFVHSIICSCMLIQFMDIEWLYQNIFIYSNYDGLLACFQFGVIRKNTAITFLCMALGTHSRALLFISIGYTRRGGIDESIHNVWVKL